MGKRKPNNIDATMGENVEQILTVEGRDKSKVEDAERGSREAMIKRNTVLPAEDMLDRKPPEEDTVPRINTDNL